MRRDLRTVESKTQLQTASTGQKENEQQNVIKKSCPESKRSKAKRKDTGSTKKKQLNHEN